ncbi:MAG: APC family permease [Acidimicrobiia bacterium]
MTATIRRLLVGRPLPTKAASGERLVKILALAIFSSDAISSTAYASEEVLDVLIPQAGLKDAINALLPISIVVIVLLALVAFSYRQTIHAYPGGGGSYIVSRENLGRIPSLVAGGSLMVDYTLTVAVSVSSGVAAVTSAFPDLNPYRVWLCLAVVAMLAIGNLRGMQSSGRLFALPTYLYIASLAGLIVLGLARSFLGDLDPLPTNEARVDQFTGGSVMLAGLTPFILLRGFSSGAIALTGVEAISNGVPAFRKPEPRNAAITLTWMATILGAGFFFIALLVQRINPTPYAPDSHNYQTLLSILGQEVYGGKNAAYLVLQASTALILALAANTAFADFPRVSSIIARDGFLPQQLAVRGDRLVFSNGIMALAVVASILLVAFGGITNSLIPLYAVGVFTAFTLSQSGMVVHHRRRRERAWRRGLIINATGALATGLVLAVVVVTKFTIGAWIPLVLIPVAVMGFLAIRRHYSRVEDACRVPDGWHAQKTANIVVVVFPKVSIGPAEAVAYVRTLAADHIEAVAVAIDDDDRQKLQADWARTGLDQPLVILDSPYRRYVDPLLEHLDLLSARWPDAFTTVVIPQYAVAHYWEEPLHNQLALQLESRLRYRPRTAIVTFPFRPAATESDPRHL